MIAIVDYDAGNVTSVGKALRYIGETAVVTGKPEEIRRADKVILPGVGAFGDAMGKLKKYGLESVLKEVTKKGTPFLGICLGLQLLFSGSEESPGVCGLSLLKGEIVRFPNTKGMKIPQIGWNSIHVKEGSKLLSHIGKAPHVYFVHSYYLQAACEEEVAAYAEYGVTIHAAVEKGNIFACQFHPEKSGETGLQILRNFAAV